MINKGCYVMILFILTSLILFCDGNTVYAQPEQSEEARLLEQYTTKGKLHLFMQSEKPVEEISYQIGSNRNHEVGWHTLREAEEERKTYILIDNSLSVGRQHKERIEIVLTDLFANASDNEKFMISVFGETTESLTEYTNLYQPLEDAVLQMEYYNRETYLTDALYQIIQAWNQETLEEDVEPVYKRIILISDGQESEHTKYTREELYLLLSQNSYPIYAIGCVTGGNVGALSHMSALSRITGAASYVITEDGDLEGIVSRLLSERDLIHVTVIPEPEMQNGNILNSKITLVTDGVETDVLAETRLPLRAEGLPVSDNTVVETNTVTTEETAAQAPMEHTDGILTHTDSDVSMHNNIQKDTDHSGQDKKRVNARTVIAVVIVTFILLAGCYFLLLWREHGHTFFDDEYNEDDDDYATVDIKKQRSEAGETTLLRSETRESGTRMLFGEYNTYEVRLTDQSNPAKFFSFPVNDSVIIGRNSQNCNVVIDYDESVSGRHCELESRNGRFFIRDLRSLNGTRVNGIKVLSETEIFSGNILRLGQVEMKVGWSTFE